MKKRRFILFLILFIFINACITFANSAGPPGITIISGDGPDDLEVFFVMDGVEYKTEVMSKIGEKYYVDYDQIGYGIKLEKVIFRSSEKYFEVDMTRVKIKYDNLFTLDFDKETLTEGKSTTRTIILTSLRVVLTLIIEGIIFYKFGYRKVYSWIMFFIINLLTQGYLNISLNTISPVDFGYMMSIMLVMFEFVILISELVLFAVFLRERKVRFTLLFVLLANAASLMVGLFLFPMLPV